MTDIFLAKFEPDGDRVFDARIGSPGLDFGTAVAIGPRDEILAGGTFTGVLSLGDEQRAGRTDALSFYVARLDPAGDVLWLQTAQSFHAVGQSHVAVGGAFSILPLGEDLLVAGLLFTTLAFDGATLQSPGGADAYLARFADDGTLLWAHRYGGVGSDEARGLALDSAGRVVATGWVEGPVAFGTQVVSQPQWLGAFVLRMLP
jgi:hypothetical protein